MKKKYETTDKHYDSFTKYLSLALGHLGIGSGWEILTYHEELDEADALAMTSWDMDARGASFHLNTMWNVKPTQEQIKRTACHEVLHLLLADLHERAFERFTTKTEIQRAAEGIVITLERMFAEAV